MKQLVSRSTVKAHLQHLKEVRESRFQPSVVPEFLLLVFTVLEPASSYVVQGDHLLACIFSVFRDSRNLQRRDRQPCNLSLPRRKLGTLFVSAPRLLPLHTRKTSQRHSLILQRFD